MQQLILLHGALGTQAQFDNCINDLQSNFEVYRFNFEGHGNSLSDKDFSIELFTQNLKRFIDDNRLQNAILFGYSMGGYVALNMTYMYPEHDHKIVTLGTKFDWNPESSKREVKLLNPELIEQKVPQFGIKLKQDHAPQDWKLVMIKTAKMMINLGNDNVLTKEKLNQITNKVIIGIGVADQMVSIEESSNVANWLPNGTLVKLNGVPHPIDKIDKSVLVDYICQNC